jgi:hypothetical protein
MFVYCVQPQSDIESLASMIGLPERGYQSVNIQHEIYIRDDGRINLNFPSRRI